MTTAYIERTDTGAATGADTGEFDLEDRHALRRVAGLSTELTDVTEVEYRALRLERVVLIGVWTDGTAARAENSLLELSRLADHVRFVDESDLPRKAERLMAARLAYDHALRDYCRAVDIPVPKAIRGLSREQRFDMESALIGTGHEW